MSKPYLKFSKDEMIDQLVVRLKNRSDFIKIAKKNVFHTKAFVLQACERTDSLKKIGVGFTCSKKVGNAVTRNKAKRRLKEIAKIVIPKYGKVGWNYVLIGRQAQTVDTKLSLMIEDLKNGIIKVHSKN